MEYIQSILENTSTPILAAFLLGILTAISPCPMATNITSIGYISRDVKDRRQIFVNGLLYTFGRVLTYTILAMIIIPILKEGASMFHIQKTISKYGELFIAPILILIGLFMLLSHRLNLPKLGVNINESTTLKSKGGWGALFLGVLFSLAFCPTSGVFYFGMLLPMSVADSTGYLLPIVYAIATGIPVVVVAWVLAYSISRLGTFYHRVQVMQKWMNQFIAWLFIVIGLYLAYTYYV